MDIVSSTMDTVMVMDIVMDIVMVIVMVMDTAMVTDIMARGQRMLWLSLWRMLSLYSLDITMDMDITLWSAMDMSTVVMVRIPWVSSTDTMDKRKRDKQGFKVNSDS